MSIPSSFKKEFQRVFQDRVLFNERVAPFVAYRVGGPADILVFPKNESELDHLRRLSHRFNLPITTIGTGTNLLVTDKGIRGITLSLQKAFQKIKPLAETDQGIEIRVGGGVEKPQLLNWAIERGLSGLEFSAGVPGTLGGGIYMNAGTKYGCYADILKRLRVYDFEKGGVLYDRKDLKFSYRHSPVGNRLVLWTDLVLQIGSKKNVQKEVERIIEERAAKQPLHLPSCGSTFKNPPSGLSAGRLIERAELKGTRIGGAEISPKHANFILNHGNATASDILALIDLVKMRVRQDFQVELECEVVIVGESGAPNEVQTEDRVL